MAAGGYLVSFFQQMLWLHKNYASVNVTPYGYINGGWAASLQALSGIAAPLRPFLLLCTALSAILPVVALVGWGTVFAWKRTVPFLIPYLLACMIGYVASTYPRPDIGHLTTVMPLSYVLVTALICRYLKSAARLAIFLVMVPWVLMPLMRTGLDISAETSLSTPVGQLHVSRDLEGDVSRLLSLVRPGDTLYVHPYLPLFYFLTQASNSTRFSYLGPAMMTESDEKFVLDDLQRKPPHWVLYFYVTTESLIGTFPSAKGRNPRFDKIESWIHENYAPLDRPLRVSGYQLLARKTGAGPVDTAHR
jgi:hypothetical protein